MDAVSIWFMKSSTDKGLMIDKSPELSTGLVLRDRLANYLLRNDLSSKS